MNFINVQILQFQSLFLAHDFQPRSNSMAVCSSAAVCFSASPDINQSNALLFLVVFLDCRWNFVGIKGIFKFTKCI